MKNPFKGLYVPLVTPFDESGGIDYPSLKRLIAYCNENGADGFVALGTTAEAPTLSPDEREKILRLVTEQSGGKPVIAGAGSNCTEEAVRLTRRAEVLGANGVLSVCPYYNKPPKTGIIAHFTAIASCTALPVVLYDVPTRTGSELTADAVEILSKTDNIVGIKEASPRAEKFDELTPLLSDEFALTCGSDELTLHALDAGAVGLISAAANLLPKAFAEILKSYFSGERQKASDIYCKHAELIKGLYAESNPAPLKYALNKLLGIKNVLRLPMCPISRKNEQLLDSLLKNYL